MAFSPDIRPSVFAQPSVTVDGETNGKEAEAVHAPDDVVAGILGQMEGDWFTTDHREVHTAFLSLRKKYPLLLERFAFANNGIYEWSPLLERVFWRLGLSRLLGTIGSDFNPYVIQNRSYIESKILPKFTVEENEALGEMAKEFWEACGVKEEP